MKRGMFTVAVRPPYFAVFCVLKQKAGEKEEKNRRKQTLSPLDDTYVPSLPALPPVPGREPLWHRSPKKLPFQFPADRD